jgi:hypothetical protein
MKCEKFEKWILRSLDNRLPQEKQTKLEDHIKSCPICQERREEYRTIIGLLKQEKVQEPKPYFWERLQAKIREKQDIPRWASIKQWSLRAVPVSFIFVLVMTLAIVLFFPSQDEELSQSEALLLRNLNPLEETQLLFDEKLENQNLILIFSSLEEQNNIRRPLP